MPGMRMAKATTNDFDTTRKFLQSCEMMWDNRDRYSFIDLEGQWETWDDEDEDKIELLKIRQELCDEEGVNVKQLDNRLVIYEFIKRRYKRCDCNWGRVVMGADILIEQVCDPQKDYLDYSPYLEEFHVAPEQ
jgi:hypothetical protein